MKKNYNNRVILKPWGEEYVIFKDKKKIAITYLKLKKGFSTSLHCHPNKKTGFLILKGTAEVQVGIYKKNIKKYKPLSILVLRPGLFHKIKASNNTDLFALEIENPYDKKDLVRMIDDYGRSKKSYESLDNSRPFESRDIIFSIPNKNKKNLYILNSINIELKFYKNFKQYKSYDDKSVSIILSGNIITNNKTSIIGTGEIVKSFTLKKLSQYFKVNKEILILKAWK